MDGIFIINKEKGCTSHDVVSKTRKILHTKKVGHAGTLDPMARGVLPILVGKGTKLSKYLINHDKTYIAKIQLGEKRDTGDSEGSCIERKDVDFNLLNEKNIKNILSQMLGKQEQIPPMYSAIKVNGKKLYEYAREGLNVELEPRSIEIYNIELLSLDLENKIMEVIVECSKGTYIRTLCENIAEKLNTVGYMLDLNRIKLGNFSIEQSITLKDLQEKQEILTIEQIFNSNEKIKLDDIKLHHFLNGVKLNFVFKDGLYRIYDLKNEFIGLGIVKNKLLKREIVIKENI